MKKSMKAMKGVKSMSKGAIAEALAAACEGTKRSEMTKFLDALADVAQKEVKRGKFTIPGIAMVKTRFKPATKARKGMAFGKEVKMKAKKARTVVKAFAVKAIKDCV